MRGGAKNLSAQPETASLYLHVAAKPKTIGELIAFAESVPSDQIYGAILALSRSIVDDHTGRTRTHARRRRLVILGILINRLIFDIEQLGRDRERRI